MKNFLLKMYKTGILLAANSLEFLLNYKSLISTKLFNKGFKVFWNSPVNSLNNKNINKIPQGIEYKLWISSRKGLYVFLKMIISYCRFVLNQSSKSVIISHTVYSNFAAILTFLPFKI